MRICFLVVNQPWLILAAAQLVASVEKSESNPNQNNNYRIDQNARKPEEENCQRQQHASDCQHDARLDRFQHTPVGKGRAYCVADAKGSGCRASGAPATA